MRCVHGPALFALLLVSSCASDPWSTADLPGSPGAGPRVLCVVAHPDDDIAFAGTLYKTATMLGGTCDEVVITNGEGGFKYSTLAERVYGLELSDEAVGRAELPHIRRHELIAADEILCMHRLFFLGQRDHRYTTDLGEVLGEGAHVWDLARVRSDLDRILARGRYDFVLTLAPTEGTHAHHKAATVLALEAVARMPAAKRPVVLCAWDSAADETPPAPGLEGRPATRVEPSPPFLFDRLEHFGHRDALDYRIVANWAIAEHKSQGTMQTFVNQGEHENYFLFVGQAPDAGTRAAAWFEALRAPQFVPKTYSPSAGTDATP